MFFSKCVVILAKKKLRKSIFFCTTLLNLGENDEVLNLVAPVF